MKKVTLIDYGIGNIFSVRRALEACNGEVFLTAEPRDILEAERLILPGVGAFKDGMNGLRERNLIAPIKEYAESGRPLMGICLGMQMLLEGSEEFGHFEGLGLIPGIVKGIPKTKADGSPHKIPHIGWNALQKPLHRPDWSQSILKGIEPGASVYFVHSYTPVPNEAGHRLADASYNGQLISAIVQAGSVYGCQFHPERSGSVGLKIMHNFLNLVGNV